MHPFQASIAHNGVPHLFYSSPTLYFKLMQKKINAFDKGEIANKKGNYAGYPSELGRISLSFFSGKGRHVPGCIKTILSVYSRENNFPSRPRDECLLSLLIQQEEGIRPPPQTLPCKGISQRKKIFFSLFHLFGKRAFSESIKNSVGRRRLPPPFLSDGCFNSFSLSFCVSPYPSLFSAANTSTPRKKRRPPPSRNPKKSWATKKGGGREKRREKSHGSVSHLLLLLPSLKRKKD